MQSSLFSLFDDRPRYIPSFAEEVTNLDRIPSILYRGLEDAAYKVRSYRDREFPNRQLDPGLAAALFRMHGLENLRKEGVNAQEDHFKWTFDRIPFLGISFYYRDRHIRVLKGSSGVPPGCGYSLRKRRFYNQVPSSYLERNKPVHTSLNLIVLWDLDYMYGLSRLWLACPERGGKQPADISCYWCDPLQHPGEMSPQVFVDPKPNNQDDLDTLIVPLDEDRDKEASNDR